MALFGRDYDRDYGYYGRPRGDERYGMGGWWRYDRDYGAAGEYDRDYGFKSRWQTDYGDPFGDRISHTPIRSVRGEFHPRYGREYAARERGWRGTPSMGYARYDEESYGRRGGRWRGEPGWSGEPGYRGYRGYRENRYDQGWF